MKTFAKFVMDHARLVFGPGTAPPQRSALTIRLHSHLWFITLLACFPGLRDAAAQTWEQVGSMSAARQLHTATLLPDGRALIAGGYMLSSTEMFDPRTASWTTTAPMSTNRYGPTATLL